MLALLRLHKAHVQQGFAGKPAVGRGDHSQRYVLIGCCILHQETHEICIYLLFFNAFSVLRGIARHEQMMFHVQMA